MNIISYCVKNFCLQTIAIEGKNREDKLLKNFDELERQRAERRRTRRIFKCAFILHLVVVLCEHLENVYKNTKKGKMMLSYKHLKSEYQSVYENFKQKHMNELRISEWQQISMVREKYF